MRISLASSAPAAPISVKLKTSQFILAALAKRAYKEGMMTMPEQNKNITILAVPKGRILEELTPVLTACDIIPEDDFFKDSSRKLQFKTNHQALEIIRVRAFDVATFVAYGAADIGVVNNDALPLPAAMMIWEHSQTRPKAISA